MAAKNNVSNGSDSARRALAMWILICSYVSITGVAVYAIVINKENTLTILNIILPVFATWVGTIIAFYFGRENFESANQQVRKLVEQISPDKRAKMLVSNIMRRIANIDIFTIPAGKSNADIKLAELRAKYNDNISRLPIVDSSGKPMYMIHKSNVETYILSGGNETDTLETFLNSQKSKEKREYGLNKGFVVVSEETTIEAAKQKMEQHSPCQDIFITKEGSADESLSGWISNVRLTKYLQS